jgi:hypothetical protein
MAISHRSYLSSMRSVLDPTPTLREIYPETKDCVAEQAWSTIFTHWTRRFQVESLLKIRAFPSAKRIAFRTRPANTPSQKNLPKFTPQ